MLVGSICSVERNILNEFSNQWKLKEKKSEESIAKIRKISLGILKKHKNEKKGRKFIIWARNLEEETRETEREEEENRKR